MKTDVAPVQGGWNSLTAGIAPFPPLRELQHPWPRSIRTLPSRPLLYSSYSKSSSHYSNHLRYRNHLHIVRTSFFLNTDISFSLSLSLSIYLSLFFSLSLFLFRVQRDAGWKFRGISFKWNDHHEVSAEVSASLYKWTISTERWIDTFRWIGRY